MTVRGNGRGEDCGEAEDHVGPNLDGRWAECRPPWAWVIVPMCSAPGCIPGGSAHAGGHLKVYLDVAAIRVRRSTQGSNLFQLLERARGRRNEDEYFLCAWGGQGGGLWLHLDKVVFSQKTQHGYLRRWSPPLASLPSPVHILDTTLFLLCCFTFNAIFGSGNKYAETDRRTRGSGHDSRDMLPYISCHATVLRL